MQAAWETGCRPSVMHGLGSIVIVDLHVIRAMVMIDDRTGDINKVEVRRG